MTAPTVLPCLQQAARSVVAGLVLPGHHTPGHHSPRVVTR